jgi:hypothetical protein
MATYKITDTELNKITKLLDKVSKTTSPFYDADKNGDEAFILSQHIKNNYTKIK